MPRRRSRDREQLPKYVYRSKGRYVWRAYLGVEDGHAFAPDVPLCSVDAPLTEVWEAYRAVQANTAAAGTLGWLLDDYLASPQFAALADSTRAMYERNARTIRKTRLKGGREFGDVLVRQTTPGTYRRYIDKRSGDGAPVQANRELSFLKTAFAWAYERDRITDNPVAKVKKNRETTRNRYITDAEYRHVYNLATPAMKCAMELAYLCRARKIEVCGFKRSHCTNEGLLINRAKGSKTQIIRWTPRLRAAVDLGKQASGKVMTLDPYILNRHGGGPITESGFNTA